MKQIYVVVLSLLLCTGGAANILAGGSNERKTPTADDITKALLKKGPTRGPLSDDVRKQRRQLINVLKEKMLRGIPLDGEERTELAEIVVHEPGIDLDIPFEFNSADLSREAEPVLRELGKAMARTEFKNKTFVIAGHTDIKGTEDYNQSLSERRANTIRAYVKNNYGVSTDQMIVVGYGEEQLKSPDAPFAAENRRVQIVSVDTE